MTDSGLVVDNPGQAFRGLQDIRLASITSCEAKWLEFGLFSGPGSRFQVVVVYPPVSDDLKLLFEMEAG